MSTVITNPAIVSELFASVAKAFAEHHASKVPMIRYDELTGEQIETLNDWIVTGCSSFAVDPNVPGMLEVLAGLRECKPGEAPFRISNGKPMYAERNANNRLKQDSRIKPISKADTYSNKMARRRWLANLIDPFVYDTSAQILSAQHRIDAMLEARDAGYPIPTVYVVAGFPWQLKDALDKGKARSKKDDNFTDPNIVPMDLVRLVQLHTSGETTDNAKGEAVKERQKLTELRSKIAGMVHYRLNNRDIAVTGDKLGFDVESQIVHRLGYSVVPSFESKHPETGDVLVSVDGMECYSLDLLACKLWEASKGSKNAKKAWAKYLFNPAVVGSCLILASNDSAYVEAELSKLERLPNETVEEFADRKEALRSRIVNEADLRIDWELVEKVIELLQSATFELDSANKVASYGGELGECLAMLYTESQKFKSLDKAHVYAPMSIGAMSACVQLVQNIRAGDYSSNVFTKYTPKEGEYSPIYRCFGGVDAGYIQVEKAKKAKAS